MKSSTSSSSLLLLLSAVGVVLLSAELVFSATLNLELQFVHFMEKYGKDYSTPEEKELRYNIFKANLEKIDELNRKSKGATYSINQFADLTADEFRKHYLLPQPIIPTPPEKRSNVLQPKPDVELPPSLDWVAEGAVTKIKNQEQCGSCWAFSVTENVESMWILAGKGTNTTVDLAPQQIVDCDQSDGGCEGGNPPTAYDYIISAGGLEGEVNYPYTARDGVCAFNSTDVVAKISTWKYATSWYSEDELQKNLVSWGPLSVCVDASNWQHYSSGVMTWEECALINILDHCVQLVGYQTKTANGDYWVVRNSWGTGWGIQGYIWLEMGSDTCGIAHEATTAVV